jgi:hypothetical protein
VRLFVFYASSVLAAGLLLSACSSGGGVSQALPGGSQPFVARDSGAQLNRIGVEPLAASCPAKYDECETISKTKSFKQEWCVVKKGTTGCKHLYPGTFTWSGPVKKTNGKKFTSIVTSFKPNPGNPTELTLSEKKAVASSKGKVSYYASIKACNTSSECTSASLIGIITQ